MGNIRVAIIDGGGANIASLRFAFERLGVDSSLTTDADTIRRASHVVLPGVGAAADAMQRLDASGLTTVIPELTQPVLGICLGMQLLAESSAEHETQCLGVIPGTAEKLKSTPQFPVPNMGWCRVKQKSGHPLLRDIADGGWFYFVHSYALPDSDAAIGVAAHSDNFAAIVSAGNFYATQFHPERSAANGAKLLRNFLQIN